MKRPVINAVVLSAAILTCGAAEAQLTVPFQVTSGTGTLERFPVLPDDIGLGLTHNIALAPGDSGTATVDGVVLNYSGSADIRVVGITSPSEVTFDSAVPFSFDFGGGDSFQMHYGRVDFGGPGPGVATVGPGDGAGLSDVEFLATFNVVPGSGTGAFSDLIDGSLFMTAVMDEVDLTQPDIPYSWTSDVGSLTFIPEPGAAALLGVAGLAFSAARRR